MSTSGRRLAVAAGAALAASLAGACASRARGLPPGPPPEYEQPPLPAWDAGAPRAPVETSGAADAGARRPPEAEPDAK